MDTKDTLRLKRERGVVLASQLVKELAQGKVGALRRAEPVTPKKEKPTREVLAYKRDYLKFERLRNRLGVRMKRLGWYMSGRQLYPQGTSSNAVRNAHAQKQQRLIASVQVLRTHTLTQLIAASPTQAQAIVVKFQRALQAITL